MDFNAFDLFYPAADYSLFTPQNISKTLHFVNTKARVDIFNFINKIRISHNHSIRPRSRSAKNVAALRFHLRLRLGEIKCRRFLTGLFGMVMTDSYILVE